MKKQAQIIVSGLVQGVSFRAYTQQMARRLGLQGYVRNLGNGDVEIVAEGEAGPLDSLLAWARTGPPGAEVEDVRVTFCPPTGAFPDFRIRY